MEYKDTLNLPRTDFPMKADLVTREPERLKKWQAADLYGKIQAQRAGAEKFVLHDGPPFANGDVHIGTALNKILKDIIVKYQTLRGKSAPYIPGWDCHGLPIEFKVSQEMRKAGDTAADPATIRRACEAYKGSVMAADDQVGPRPQLQGRRVIVADGSSAQMPGSQKPGCGFPLMKFVVLFSLCSGAILNVAIGNLHYHDLRLLRALWDQLKEGDILLGDRAYGEYTTLAGLVQLGIDVVARLHSRRKVDFRKARRLGRNDGLFVWTKSCQPSEILSPGQWDLLPAQITVRIIRFTTVIRGFRNRRVTLVTSLLDPVLYPAEELIGLYARRWQLELSLRDLKTTMGMEQLRCKSPEMAQKELLAYLVAHNLVRCVMAQAVARHHVELERVSFKGSLDGLRQFSHPIDQAPNGKLRRQLWEDLLRTLARSGALATGSP